MTDILLYVFGAVGAFIYAFPLYLTAASAVPPGRFAVAVLTFSVFVGAMIAAALVPLLGARWPFLVDPAPYPLAVGVGLAANPLVPLFVRKVTGWAESYRIGESK